MMTNQSPPINLRARRATAAPAAPAAPAPKPGPKPKPPKPKPERPRPTGYPLGEGTVQPPPTPRKLRKPRPLRVVAVPALEGPPSRFQLKQRGQSWKPYLKLPEGAVNLIASGWNCPMRIVETGDPDWPWGIVWAAERPAPAWFGPGNFPVRTDAAVWVHMAYGRWIREAEQADVRARAVAELRGRHLGCWCKPGGLCHGDILLEISNGPERAADKGS
jgi:hypothetical protein